MKFWLEFVERLVWVAFKLEEFVSFDKLFKLWFILETFVSVEELVKFWLKFEEFVEFYIKGDS
jgi:hypothetical protein